MLRHVPERVEVPELFEVVEEEVPTELAEDELASAINDGSLVTPAQEVARQEGYRDRHDWVLRRSGTMIYGRVVNEDRYGLLTDSARAEEALRRLCPIDLAGAQFPLNASARTVMEHMGAIVVRVSVDSFLLLSASSSAKSFWHAVEVSMKNVA